MKKFAIILAVVAGTVSVGFAGNCGVARYVPGQCFTTACGTSCSGCNKPACKPVCKVKPVCKPVCKVKPVCISACR